MTVLCIYTKKKTYGKNWKSNSSRLYSNPTMDLCLYSVSAFYVAEALSLIAENLKLLFFTAKKLFNLFYIFYAKLPPPIAVNNYF